MKHSFWEEKAKLISEELAQRPIEDFLSCPSIRATMYVGREAPWTNYEIEYLKENYSPPELRRILSIPDTGNPEYLRKVPFSDAVAVQQLVHLTIWSELSRIRISDLTNIVEIGGGYGMLRLIADRLGFNGTYTILDIPVISNIQSYWLGQQNLKTNLITDMADLPETTELVVAIDSLSEIDREHREPITDKILSMESSGYLFRYDVSKHWEGYDNRQYFNALAVRLPTNKHKRKQAIGLEFDRMYLLGS